MRVLSVVTLDGEQVHLMGDPNPSPSKVLASCGLDPETHTLHHVTPQGDLGNEVCTTNIDRREEPGRTLAFSAQPKGA